MLEALVASSLQLRNYWREGSKEADFVLRNGELVPLEVKAGEKVRKEDLKGLLHFMEKYWLEGHPCLWREREEKVEARRRRDRA